MINALFIYKDVDLESRKYNVRDPKKNFIKIAKTCTIYFFSRYPDHFKLICNRKRLIGAVILINISRLKSRFYVRKHSCNWSIFISRFDFLSDSCSHVILENVKPFCSVNYSFKTHVLCLCAKLRTVSSELQVISW